MNQNTNLLSVQHLKKYYGTHKAVDDISFHLERGTILGLLGPNGAGKTTLIRMITGIIYPDSGSLLFEATPFNALKHSQTIGYMPEERGLYKKMKVGDQLIYLARLKGLSKSIARQKAIYWTRHLGLLEWWDKKIGDLSKGMQQKVQFIATVIHEPKLLILDEPFSGLDPVNTDSIKKEIFKLREKGTTIIFSTHRMEQVEEICEHIFLINNGRKLIDGKLKTIKNQFKKNEFIVSFQQSLIKEDLDTDFFTYKIVNENQMILQLAPEVDNNKIFSYFIKKGYTIQSFNERLPSIHDIFVEVV